MAKRVIFRGFRTPFVAMGLAMGLGMAIGGCDRQPTEPGRPPAAAPPGIASLSGEWLWRYRAMPENARVEVITTRRPNGGFDEQSIFTEADGRVRTQRESGTWLLQDGVLKMRTWTVDGESVPKNSRLAFRIYDVVSVAPDRVTLRPSPENGSPGLWPRVTGVPRTSPETMPLIEQVRAGD